VYSSEKAAEFDRPVDSQKLPNYDTLRHVLAKHDAKLNSVRWSTNYACRAAGCVSGPTTKTSLATTIDRSSQGSH
jgi:hypothetical protein